MTTPAPLTAEQIAAMIERAEKWLPIEGEYPLNEEQMALDVLALAAEVERLRPFEAAHIEAVAEVARLVIERDEKRERCAELAAEAESQRKRAEAAEAAIRTTVAEASRLREERDHYRKIALVEQADDLRGLRARAEAAEAESDRLIEKVRGFARREESHAKHWATIAETAPEPARSECLRHKAHSEERATDLRALADRYDRKEGSEP